MGNNIAIAFLCIDLVFVNSVCIGVAMYGFKLFKQMKSFIDMFGGGIIENGFNKDKH